MSARVLVSCTPVPAFIEGLGSPSHWMLLLFFGVLLFGKRLPEMSRSLGKAFNEFTKGWRGLEDEIGGAVSTPAQERPLIEPPRPPQRIAPPPKFEGAEPQDTPPKAE